METEPYQSLRLSAQRALTKHITASLRAVSVDLENDSQIIKVQFIFDGEPSAELREMASTVSSEIIADFSSAWNIEEAVINSPWPQPIQHLQWLVFHRCEDEFVPWRQDAAKVGRSGSSEHEA